MGTIFAMSFYASIMAVFIIIFRALFYDKMPKKTFKILWLIMALRMLIPVFIPTLQTIHINDDYTRSQVRPLFEFSPVIIASNLAKYFVSFDKMSSLEKGKYLFYNISALLCATGAVLAVIIFAYGYFKNIRKYKASKNAQSHDISSVINSYGIRRKVNVKVSDKTKTPFTYGIFKPTIVCPENFSDYDQKTTELAISHELTHIKYFDAFYKIIIAAAFCVHWFNPFAWIMLILSCRDTELSCDEKILEKFPDAKKDYANSIIEFEEKRSASPLLSRLSRSPVKKRVKYIMRFEKAALFPIIAAIVIMLCTTVVSALVPAVEFKSDPTPDWVELKIDLNDGKYYFLGDTESSYLTIENGTIKLSLDDEERMRKMYTVAERSLENHLRNSGWDEESIAASPFQPYDEWIKYYSSDLGLKEPQEFKIARWCNMYEKYIVTNFSYDENGFLCVEYGMGIQYINNYTIAVGGQMFINIPE